MVIFGYIEIYIYETEGGIKIGHSFVVPQVVDGVLS